MSMTMPTLDLDRFSFASQDNDDEVFDLSDISVGVFSRRLKMWLRFEPTMEARCRGWHMPRMMWPCRRPT